MTRALPVRRIPLADEGRDTDMQRFSPSERVGMMWQLALQAWMFKEGLVSMSRDFVEMLSALSAAGARFLIVGAHALAAHGTPRATGDLDIWIQSTADNAARVLEAIGDLRVGVIGRADFIVNKKAVGRAKDLLDIDLLPPE